MATRRGRNRKGEGGRLREEIIAAGTRVLANAADARQVTIRAVAREADVTPPAIYLHFPDRSALLAELVSRAFRAFDQFLVAESAEATGPMDAMQRRAHAYLTFAETHPGEYRVAFSAAGLGPDDIGVSADQAHPGRPSFEALVESVAACLGREANPLPKATQLWCFLHGMADLRLTKPEMPWPDLHDLVDATLTNFGLAPATQ